MTYYGMEIAALLELHRQSIVHVSTAMLEAELNRLNIHFSSKPYGDKTREYTLINIEDKAYHKSGYLDIYADHDMRLVFHGIISDGKRTACVETVRTRNSQINYFPDDISCFERKDCLIYRPCLMHDIMKPVLIKDLFVQNQIVIPLPEPVKIADACHLLKQPAYFVLLESEAEEFKKLFS